MRTFKELVEAVEENNEINGGKWSDWSHCGQIQEVYGKLKPTYSYHAKSFLSALIRDNGENEQLYLDAMSELEYGYVIN